MTSLKEQLAITRALERGAPKELECDPSDPLYRPTREVYKFYAHARNALPAYVDALERAMAALEFYADRDNWDEDFTPTVWDDGNVDLGNRARAALEDIEKGFGEKK